MKIIWGVAIWFGINVALMLGIMDLLNSPSTVAATAAVIVGLLQLTVNYLLLKYVMKKLKNLDLEDLLN